MSLDASITWIIFAFCIGAACGMVWVWHAWRKSDF